MVFFSLFFVLYAPSIERRLRQPGLLYHYHSIPSVHQLTLPAKPWQIGAFEREAGPLDNVASKLIHNRLEKYKPWHGKLPPGNGPTRSYNVYTESSIRRLLLMVLPFMEPS